MTDALIEAIRDVLMDYLGDAVDTPMITAALQAIEAAGYRVVPVEATRRMIAEGECKAMYSIGYPVDNEALPRVWSAMLSAAPRVGEGV